MKVALFFIIFSICLNTSFAQSNNEVKNSEEYIRISDFESAYTWTIASMSTPPTISNIFVDSFNRLYFAFFDTSQLELMFVSDGLRYGSFTKKPVDPDKNYGHLLSMATDTEFSNVYIAYTDSKNNIWYTDNNNNRQFNSYEVNSLYILGTKKLDIVISSSGRPIIFSIDVRGNMMVSRFYNNNFFTEPTYTNKRLKSMIPMVMPNGYSILLQEEATGNVFYGSRLTNTKFVYDDNESIITNALLYDVYQTYETSFSIPYTTVESPNDINIIYFDVHGYKRELLTKSNSKVDKISITREYPLGDAVLYSTEDNNLYLHLSNQTIELSNFLGKVEGDIRVQAAGYSYYYIVYYSIDFNELRVARLNLNDFPVE